MYDLFKSIVSGKRVALVGPSEHLIDDPQGELIDSYDVVARINWTWPVPEEYQAAVGSKTHILGHCCHPYLHIRDLPFQQLEYVVYLDASENERLGFDRNVNPYFMADRLAELGVPSHTYGKNCPVYQSIDAEQATPGIGLYLAQLMLNSGVTELYLTGFSYYCGYGYLPYYPLDALLGNVEDLKQRWDQDIESFHLARCMCRVCEHPLVKCDKVLWKIHTYIHGKSELST